MKMKLKLSVRFQKNMPNELVYVLAADLKSMFQFSIRKTYIIIKIYKLYFNIASIIYLSLINIHITKLMLRSLIRISKTHSHMKYSFTSVSTPPNTPLLEEV